MIDKQIFEEETLDNLPMEVEGMSEAQLELEKAKIQAKLELEKAQIEQEIRFRELNFARLNQEDDN